MELSIIARLSALEVFVVQVAALLPEESKHRLLKLTQGMADAMAKPVEPGELAEEYAEHNRLCAEHIQSLREFVMQTLRRPGAIQ